MSILIEFSKMSERRQEGIRRVLSLRIEDLSPTELEATRTEIRNFITALRNRDIATTSNENLTVAWFEIKKVELTTKLSLVEQKLDEIKSTKTIEEEIQELSDDIEENQEIRKFLNQQLASAQSSEEIKEARTAIETLNLNDEQKEKRIMNLQDSLLARDLDENNNKVHSTLMQALNSPKSTRT